jgi:tight adherence protein C
MSLAIFYGAIAGLGILGVVCGLRVAPPSLDAIASTVNHPLEGHSRSEIGTGMSTRIGTAITSRLDIRTLATNPRWAALTRCLAITGQSLEQLVTQILILVGAGALVPPVLWAVAQSGGVSIPAEVPIVAALLAVSAGLVLPITELVKKAHERQRHFRVVLGSFVDLVVLSLAGGVGVEGALFAASQVSDDWAARRMARTLLTARDSGQSPWVALGQLGDELGIAELVELSTTLQLAGTEGARIRQSLSARAVSIRRHEQADAESAANAMTERLFLPGALLLVGFLLFVGYPAFSHILGGF